MHELAIAESIVRIAGEHAAGRPVHRVDVKVGHLRQVVPDSLAFAWELLTDGTALEGAQLDIEHVPAVGRCRACGTESEQDGFPLRCATCASLDLEVVRGEELVVDALELDDLMTTTNGRTHGR
jgi:hydrogenase nickel incorporation protein HypA/HybF